MGVIDHVTCDMQPYKTIVTIKEPGYMASCRKGATLRPANGKEPVLKSGILQGEQEPILRMATCKFTKFRMRRTAAAPNESRKHGSGAHRILQGLSQSKWFDCLHARN